MTAGRGVIHQEYHSEKFTREGGIFEMCQLWVNLPKKHKMVKPRYQAIKRDTIPQIELPVELPESAGGDTGKPASARIIAGELNGVKGVAKTYSPVQMWDLNFPVKKSVIDLAYPADHNLIIFVRTGSVDILSGIGEEATILQTNQVALMQRDGAEAFRIRVNSKNTSLVILGGEPLNEPIVAQGPFVMNTKEQIHQAISDFHTGKMGR